MGVSYYFYWTFNYWGDLILHKAYPYAQLDYVYADMNCAIHPAVKADPMMSIDDMYDAVIKYIDKIFKFANPQKGIYMAIDGVAPRAKMSQQRTRRYKSVMDKKVQREIKIKHGMSTESNGVDFNMISPGTDFMVTLSERLKKYIQEKKNTDWAGLEVILSDASIPGEGEHKIMNHIRNDLPKGYRAGVYGLDSDLIFLCLVNNRPDMVLIRETVEFGNQQKGKKGRRGQRGQRGQKGQRGRQPKSNTNTNADESKADKLDLTFLTIDDLRNILTKILSPIISLTEMEQYDIFNKVGIPGMPEHPKLSYYKATEDDKRRLILDYAFFCFMLGNDFLPYLPSLKIRDGGLEIALLTYKSVAWRVGSYLVREDGISINERYFDMMLREFATIENSYLQELTKSRRIRIGKIMRRINRLEPYEREVEATKYLEHQVRDTLHLGNDRWRIRYYYDQFNIKYRHKKEFSRKIKPICHAYLEGMKWTLLYYQGKHDNWTWDYPYDAAPSVKDLLEHFESFDFNQYKFTKNKPVRPFVQLMSILPPESAHLLPDELGIMMTSHSSALHYMYPLKVYLNTPPYKKYLWECHPMLPEIDHELIERLVEHNASDFSKADTLRNTNSQKCFVG